MPSTASCVTAQQANESGVTAYTSLFPDGDPGTGSSATSDRDSMITKGLVTCPLEYGAWLCVRAGLPRTATPRRCGRACARQLVHDSRLCALYGFHALRRRHRDQCGLDAGADCCLHGWVHLPLLHVPQAPVNAPGACTRRVLALARPVLPRAAATLTYTFLRCWVWERSRQTQRGWWRCCWHTCRRLTPSNGAAWPQSQLR